MKTNWNSPADVRALARRVGVYAAARGLERRGYSLTYARWILLGRQ